MRVQIPPSLKRLPELAYNLLWTWRPEVQELFIRLDPGLWESTGRNPVRLLLETENLEKAAADDVFIDAYHEALRGFDAYLEDDDPRMERAYPGFDKPVVYFSAEFGLHECLPIYSGGLGVLAGDHVKSASDLGLPLVGVGILYSQGYFRQRINAAGRQEEAYEELNPETRPVFPARDTNGDEILVSVELPNRDLYLKAWKVEVGRASMLLLDADIPENSLEDHELTARLYGGDQRTRIVQEMILGVGGVRALRAAGVEPSVYHMNEGHAAFSVLERLRELAAAGNSFEKAREEVKRSTVFTTHTPVPAGHDAFVPALFWQFMGDWPEALDTDEDGLWSLGHKQEEWGVVFNMTVLAMNLSAATNAVSDLHREVTEEMWGYLAEKSGHDRRPITHVNQRRPHLELALTRIRRTLRP